MGSALLNTTTDNDSAPQGERTPASGSAELLRQQVAERLAAHRGRRSAQQQPTAGADLSAQSAAANPQKSRIATAVAERYAQAQSYRAFLAVEAERAVQQAMAAAEIATRNARAVAEAQQQLLDRLSEAAAEEPLAAVILAPPQDSIAPASKHPAELEARSAEERLAEPMLWAELESSPNPAPPRPSRPRGAASAESQTTAPPVDVPVMRVVLHEEIRPLARDRGRQGGGSARREDWNEAEAWALDEEISFRQAPVFEEPSGPPMPLPANLIEFPRQLVAPRKARPRYAEGPLRDEDAAPTDGAQLRIFEVDSGQISTSAASAPTAENAMPQWTSLWLDAPTATAMQAATASQEGVAEAPYFAVAVRPMTAALSRRALAAAVDCAIVAAGWSALIATFAAGAGYLTAGSSGWNSEAVAERAAAALRGLPISTAVTAALISGLLFALLYQVLFFTFSDSTPGMRWARIGLCTFKDENPSRKSMRRRIPALLLSTLCLGLGFAWSLLDEDRLCWHDLISRMYPRSY